MLVNNITKINTNKNLKIISDKTKYFLDKPTDYSVITEGAEYYKEFLKAKINCPTKADIMMHETKSKQPVVYTGYYNLNKKILSTFPEIRQLLNKVKDVEKNFSRTAKIRQYIIEHNRIQSEGVLPKLTGFAKIKFSRNIK